VRGAAACDQPVADVQARRDETRGGQPPPDFDPWLGMGEALAQRREALVRPALGAALAQEGHRRRRPPEGAGYRHRLARARARAQKLLPAWHRAHRDYVEHHLLIRRAVAPGKGRADRLCAGREA